MERPLWRVATNYAVAVVSVVVATLIRMWLDPVLGETFAFTTLIVAVIFTAWYGGVWPALFTMVLGILSVGYFFQHPRGSVAIYDFNSQVGALLYVVVGLSSMFFSESMHIARRRADAAAKELLEEKRRLELEVQERKLAQQAYSDLLRKSVTLQEEERRRIARELHDQSGQDLTALRLGLQFFSSAVNKDAATKQQFENLNALLDRVAQSAHHLAFELRPPALDELGLPTALESYLQSWSKRTQIPVDFECRSWEQRRTSDDIDTALYRVIQEALNNVAKHSGTSRVSVIVEHKPGFVLAIVEDQGRGFDVEAQASDIGPRSRLGILGMQERLKAVGGTLEIESALGSGTTVYAKVPLDHT